MDKKPKSKSPNKGENPNRFPEEPLSDQREQPYEGDDRRGAMEDPEENEEEET